MCECLLNDLLVPEDRKLHPRITLSAFIFSHAAAWNLVIPVQKGNCYTFPHPFPLCSPHLLTTLLFGSLCHKHPKPLAWGGRSKTCPPCSLLGCLVSKPSLCCKPFLSAFWLAGQWAKWACFSNTCSQEACSWQCSTVKSAAVNGWMTWQALN